TWADATTPALSRYSDVPTMPATRGNAVTKSHKIGDCTPLSRRRRLPTTSKSRQAGKATKTVIASYSSVSGVDPKLILYHVPYPIFTGSPQVTVTGQSHFG